MKKPAVTLGTRCAAIATVFLALLTGCGSGSGVVFGFHPVLLPIEISVALDGTIEVSLSSDIATPLGTFSIDVPVETWRIPPSETLLVIRRIVHGITGLSAQRGREGGHEELVSHTGTGEATAGGGVMKEDIIEINRSGPVTFLLDGGFHLTSDGNIATLSLSNTVTGIRIQTSNQKRRFTATLVNKLPTPPKMAPPGPAPPSFPTPNVACKGATSNGTVSCTAFVTGGTGSFSYQWFDNGTPIGPPTGTVNPLTVRLPIGEHLITVTVTSSNGSSFTSSATSCTVPNQGCGRPG